MAASLTADGVFSVPLLLLVPIVLLGAMWVWQRDPGREFFGWISGLALLPVLISLHPFECLRSPFGCELPSAFEWRWGAVAGTLFVFGFLAVGLEGRVAHPAAPGGRSR